MPRYVELPVQILLIARNVLSFATPLQTHQLTDGVDQLPLNTGFIAQDSVEVRVCGQAEGCGFWLRDPLSLKEVLY